MARFLVTRYVEETKMVSVDMKNNTDLPKEEFVYKQALKTDEDWTTTTGIEVQEILS